MGLSTNVSNAYDLYRTRGTLTEPPDAPLRSAPPPLHTHIIILNIGVDFMLEYRCDNVFVTAPFECQVQCRVALYARCGTVHAGMCMCVYAYVLCMYLCVCMCCV